MTAKKNVSASERLTDLLQNLKLYTVSEQLCTRLESVNKGSAIETVLEVFELEQQIRWDRKVERLRRASRLPVGKTFGNFDGNRLPIPLMRTLKKLAKASFLDRAVNVLAFGLPGTGKSHAACALGHELVAAGHSVLFTPTYKLVQDLLVAKRDYMLPKALKKLDNYELLILDDLGYVQQGPDEIEVLFTLLAERYERRSILITSNLVFSEWEKIFKNPMTTAAAIDRLVHHSEILEFSVESYRTKSKKEDKAKRRTK